AGRADDFADVRLRLPDGFHGECARALRKIGRGEVVTYGELAALAGYPGAARAAGTFCGRCSLSPFIPTHRVVASDGIGSYGDLGVGSEIRTYRRRAFDKATRYQLHTDVDEHGLAVLREAGVLSTSGAPLERPPRRVVGRSCCRGAYLRGALLGAGSLSGPRDAHLEVRASGLEGARFIAGVATRAGVELVVAERRTHAVAYAKGHDAIADTLALAGAGDTALPLA